MKISEVIRLVESDGWIQIRIRGSRRQFKTHESQVKVTIAGKASVDAPLGTLSSILKQAGLK